ncbi:MAG: hypothetical protein QXL32_04470 [Candidatus Bathyarchaeia archaeon]
MLLISTSRRPTRRILSFAKDLRNSIPNSIKLQRGKRGLKDLLNAALEAGCDRVLLITRWKGSPGKLEMMEINGGGFRAIPPLIYIKGIKLRREFGIEGRFIASSITLGRVEREGLELARSLSRFLRMPLLEDPRDARGEGTSIHISEDRAGALRVSVTSPRGAREVGPAFTIRHLIWELESHGEGPEEPREDNPQARI